MRYYPRTCRHHRQTISNRSKIGFTGVAWRLAHIPPARRWMDDQHGRIPQYDVNTATAIQVLCTTATWFFALVKFGVLGENYASDLKHSESIPCFNKAVHQKNGFGKTLRSNRRNTLLIRGRRPVPIACRKKPISSGAEHAERPEPSATWRFTLCHDVVRALARESVNLLAGLESRYRLIFMASTIPYTCLTLFTEDDGGFFFRSRDRATVCFTRARRASALLARSIQSIVKYCAK
jgi:hypothetical protein